MKAFKKQTKSQEWGYLLGSNYNKKWK